MLELTQEKKDKLNSDFSNLHKRLGLTGTASMRVRTVNFQLEDDPVVPCMAIEYEFENLGLSVILHDVLLDDQSKCFMHVFFYPEGLDKQQAVPIDHPMQDTFLDIDTAFDLFSEDSVLPDNVLDVRVLNGNHLYGHVLDGAFLNAIKVSAKKIV